MINGDRDSFIKLEGPEVKGLMITLHQHFLTDIIWEVEKFRHLIEQLGTV